MSNNPSHRGRSEHPSYDAKRRKRIYIPKYQVIKLACEILSPVHIGTGEEIPVYEYVISEGMLYKVNFDKAISRFSADELDRFNSLNEKGNYTEIRAFLADKYADKSFRKSVTQFSIPVSKEIEETYIAKIGDTENQLIINLNQRNTLSQEPVIPGSSIKGAIRTAILNLLESRYEGIIEGNAQKIEGTLLQALNFGRVDATRDPFKHLKVEDVHLPLGSTNICNVRNGLQGDDGFKIYDIQMIHEVSNSTISSNPVKFHLNIVLSSEMNVFEQKGKPPFRITPEVLINAVSKYYKERLEIVEAGFFKNTSIQGQINAIHNAVNFDEGEFLLRVGRFSGKLSITLDKHRVGRDPKSRNLADGVYPMGWIKCKRIDTN